MKNSFKTPALYNYLIYLTQLPEFCKSKEIILSYLPQFSSIDLKEDAHIAMRMALEDHETYILPINLGTNETINIFWDINFIIEKIKSEKRKSQQMAITEILEYTKISKSDNTTLEEVKLARLKNRKFKYKLKEIILTQLRVVPQLIVIDGNHRFFEAVLDKKDYVDTIIIPPDEAIYFLLPNSHKLMLLWSNMDIQVKFNTLIQG